MKKIGIATVYTGYNYGSVLQAFATKKILSDMGYEAEILKINGSLVKGRDIRLKKLITIAWRSLLHKNGAKSLKNYSTSMSKEFKEGTVELFDEFINSEISPRHIGPWRKRPRTMNMLLFFAAVIKSGILRFFMLIRSIICGLLRWKKE